MAARMGIPILANRKQHGQERKSQCKLAIAKLAIHVGYPPSAASRQRSVSGGIQDFLLRPDEQTAEKIRASSVRLLIRSSMSYSYAQFLALPRLKGVLREHGRPVKKAAAITEPILRKLLETCDFSARGARDRALILIGFTGALRRSELVALTVKDVTVDAKGMRIRIMRSKTDKAGEGAEIGIPRGKHAQTCAVSAYERWRLVADRKTGPVFFRINSTNRVRPQNDKKGRQAPPVAVQKPKKQGFDTQPLSAQAVSDILVKRAAMAGVVIEAQKRFSAHSLRVGFITAAYEKGVRDEDIMKHSRHKDLRTMRGYVERAGLVDQSPVGALDL